jgi:hypothetical protein
MLSALESLAMAGLSQWLVVALIALGPPVKALHVPIHPIHHSENTQVRCQMSTAEPEKEILQA